MSKTWESMAAASPVVVAAPAKSMAAHAEKRQAVAAGGQAPPPGQEPSVVVRTDFRATALWKPDAVTGADGHTKVAIKYPDSLTTWRATARAASAGAQFGIYHPESFWLANDEQAALPPATCGPGASYLIWYRSSGKP